jgi:hypothetical protein
VTKVGVVSAVVAVHSIEKNLFIDPSIVLISITTGCAFDIAYIESDEPSELILHPEIVEIAYDTL